MSFAACHMSMSAHWRPFFLSRLYPRSVARFSMRGSSIPASTMGFLTSALFNLDASCFLDSLSMLFQRFVDQNSWWATSPLLIFGSRRASICTSFLPLCRS
jgi:hypothetical protein